MRKATPTNATPEIVARPARSKSPLPGGHVPVFGQLSAVANSSPTVQAQLKMSREMQDSGQTKSLFRLAAEINSVEALSGNRGLHYGIPGRRDHQKNQNASRLAARDTIIQAKWVPGRDPFLMWTPSLEGYTWWFDQTDRTMAYTPDTVRDLGPEEAVRLRWRPHKEWQIEALEQIDPDVQQPANFKFEDLVAKGEHRWQELGKVMQGAGGGLDPQTQSARDWFFREYYTTVTAQKGGGHFDVGSNYNARPKSYETKRAKGEYTGTLNFEAGNMRLDQTYALGGPGEMYYNPKSGNAERMPASEVLFQQWRGAAGGRHVPRLKVKEESVAGDGWKMLKVIRQGENQDLVARPGEDRFRAMLAVPNVTAALFLIRDHGKELGITTITHIEVKKNSHILIHFG